MSTAPYGVKSTFWLQLFILLATFAVLIFLIYFLLRKLFRIERKEDKYYASTFMNPFHKKLDRTTRVVFMVLMFIGYVINVSRLPEEPLWYWQPWYFLFVMIFTTECLRVFMQWKHVANRKIYRLTLTRLVCLGLLTTAFFVAIQLGML